MKAILDGLVRNSKDLDVSALIFPQICIGCSKTLNRNEEMICLLCKHQLSYTDQWLAPDHGRSVFEGRVEVNRVISFLHYSKGGILQSMMKELKYNGRKDIGIGLGEMLGKVLSQHGLFDGVDGMVAVPLHPAKMIRRGYNQSSMIIKGLREHLDIPDMSHVLERTQFTPSQTRKNRYERFRNIDQVFNCTGQNMVRGLHILLVDDVITTGSTLEGCAHSLLQAGSKKVSVATLVQA